MIAATLAERITAELCGRLAPPYFDEVRQLSEEKDVADATQKFILSVGPRTRFFLIISNSTSPFMVRRNAERMRMARSMLSGNAREAIELPLIEAEFEGRSYALWNMRKPLSSNRLLFKAQKAIVSSSVIRWINKVAVQTLHYGDSARLASYSERLRYVSALPEAIKQSAMVSRRGFLTGEIAPLCVVQHGDLWIGNILKAPTPSGFIVIDWTGGVLDGMPFYDLIKFACSIGVNGKPLRRYMERYSNVVACGAAMAIPYVLAGLGRLHTELEFFPENRFVALCEQKYHAMRSALD